MAISPDYGLEYAQAIANAYADAELAILSRIKQYLEQGIDVPDWERQQLANVQQLRFLATSTVGETNNNIAYFISQTMDEAYEAGGASAFSDMYDSVESISAVSSLARKQAVAAIAREVTTAITGASNSILRQIDDTYRNIVSQSVSLVTAGGMTRRQATQKAINQFLGNGLMVAPAGRGQMNIADYTQMAVRTGTARASIEGHLDAMAVNGLSLVYINAGPRHCELCNDWTGKVLKARGVGSGTLTMVDAVTGGRVTVEVAGSLDDARSAGWGHPNCRCSVSAYIPGASRPKKQPFDRRGYEDQQQQRLNERRIREWKRRDALAITPEEKAKAEAKIKEYQQRQRDLMKSNPDLKRQPSREQLFKPSGGQSGSQSPLPPLPKPKTPASDVRMSQKFEPADFYSYPEPRGTAEQFDAMVEYEGSGYVYHNGYLRDPERSSADKFMRAEAKALNDMLYNTQTTFDSSVVRYQRLDAFNFESYADLETKMANLQGTIWNNKGVTSTSVGLVNGSAFSNREVKMTIHMPAGTYGARATQDYEGEFMIAPNTDFLITEVREMDNGVFHIDAIVANQEKLNYE